MTVYLKDRVSATQALVELRSDDPAEIDAINLDQTYLIDDEAVVVRGRPSLGGKLLVGRGYLGTTKAPHEFGVELAAIEGAPGGLDLSPLQWNGHALFQPNASTLGLSLLAASESDDGAQGGYVLMFAAGASGPGGGSTVVGAGDAANATRGATVNLDRGLESGDGGDVHVQAGNGATAGDVAISAGTGTGDVGGNVEIASGSNSSGDGPAGLSLIGADHGFAAGGGQLYGGFGAVGVDAGYAQINGGLVPGVGSNGARVVAVGGYASGKGGELELTAGVAGAGSGQAGGDVTLRPGTGDGAGRHGLIVLEDATWNGEYLQQPNGVGDSSASYLQLEQQDVGGDGGYAALGAGDGAAGFTGGTAIVSGGASPLPGGRNASVLVRGGLAAGTGGAVNVDGGDAGVGSDHAGGGVAIQAGDGDGAGVGGRASLTAGNNGSNAGGGVDVYGADPDLGGGGAELNGGVGGLGYDGGYVEVKGGSGGAGAGGGKVTATGGYSTHSGGDLALRGGSAASGHGGNGGVVEIKGGDGDGAGHRGYVALPDLPTSDPGVGDALWNDGGEVKISGYDGGVVSRTVTLTNAQIKALPTTGVEVIPAPGVGKTIHFLSARHVLHLVANYANVHASSSLVVKTALGVQFSNLLKVGDTLYFDYGGPIDLEGWFTPHVIYDSVMLEHSPHVAIDDEALVIRAGNVGGDYTGGDAANTMKVVVWYRIVDAA